MTPRFTMGPSARQWLGVRTCCIGDYSHHAVHYVPRTYLSYNLKFVPLPLQVHHFFRRCNGMAIVETSLIQQNPKYLLSIHVQSEKHPTLGDSNRGELPQGTGCRGSGRAGWSTVSNSRDSLLLRIGGATGKMGLPRVSDGRPLPKPPHAPGSLTHCAQHTAPRPLPSCPESGGRNLEVPSRRGGEQGFEGAGGGDRQHL